jgi:hypothetical protein
MMQTNISSARQALRTAGIKIVNDAKENLRDNGSIAQGQLRKSGRVQAVDNDPDAIDAGFPVPYAYFVEYGRRSGKMPPLHNIIEWLKKKTSSAKGIKNAFASAAAFEGRDIERYRRSIAFLIARSIAKHGTKPHAYLSPAVEKNKKAAADAIKDAIAKDIG